MSGGGDCEFNVFEFGPSQDSGLLRRIFHRAHGQLVKATDFISIGCTLTGSNLEKKNFNCFAHLPKLFANWCPLFTLCPILQNPTGGVGGSLKFFAGATKGERKGNILKVAPTCYLVCYVLVVIHSTPYLRIKFGSLSIAC